MKCSYQIDTYTFPAVTNSQIKNEYIFVFCCFKTAESDDKDLLKVPGSIKGRYIEGMKVQDM